MFFLPLHECSLQGTKFQRLRRRYDGHVTEDSLDRERNLIAKKVAVRSSCFPQLMPNGRSVKDTSMGPSWCPSTEQSVDGCGWSRRKLRRLRWML